MGASIVALITTVVTSLLPMLLKLVMYFIDKKMDNEKLKTEFLKFISEIEKDIPVKLHDRYNDQISRIKEKMRQEQVALASVEAAYNNYRDGYEDVLKKYEELLDASNPRPDKTEF